MDTARFPPTRACSFALRAVAWCLALFGVLRLGWVDAHAVLPLTRAQADIAAGAFGLPALPIDVTLACSGADAFALCVGAILAYPTAWRSRLAGAAGGTGLILALNTVRIGTLGRVVASPRAFEALHVYVWPGVLALAIAGYVFAWMRVADRSATDGRAVPLRRLAPSSSSAPLTRRFIVLTAGFVVLFVAAAPLYLESAGVLAMAAFVARAAAWILQRLGVRASAAASVLWTSRGAFMVTQECISTPLIPVYLAAVFAYFNGWRARSVALLALLPLFVALGIARLLVVALPPALVASPLFLVHAFYQLLLAVVVVFAAAVWRHGLGALAWRRGLLGLALGAALMYGLDPRYTHMVARTVPFVDAQGALALLPAYQIGLYVALCAATLIGFRWRPVVAGVSLLALSQVAAFAGLRFVVAHTGMMPHVRDVRAWALAAPLLLIVAMGAYDRPRG